MRSNTTLILLVLVLALGAFIGFFERQTETTDRRQEMARRALRFDPAKVVGLRLVTDDLQVVLEKKDEQWRITSPVQTRADAGQVARVLDHLELLERGEVISGRQQRKQNLTLADYGLDQPRARIVVQEGAREITLLVGRDAPLGGNLFIKEASKASVIAVSTNLLGELPRAVTDLRDRRLFLGFPGDATRLDLRRRDGLLQLARSEQGVWRMQKPFVGRAAYAAVQDLMDSLYEARAVDFVADSFAAASLYGLDEPAAQVSIVGGRKLGEQVLLLGKPVDGNPGQVYATVQGTETIVTVDQGLLQALGVKADDLRDRRLLGLPAYDIGYIQLDENERSVRLVRGDDGVWNLTEPRTFKANQDRLQAVLSEWTGLRIEAFVDQPGTNLATWGLAPPARQITFARKAPAPGTTLADLPPEDAVTVLVSTNDAGAGQVLVKLAQEESLYRTSNDGVRAAPMDPLYYRDLRVLDLDPAAVRTLSVQVGERTQSVERASTTNAFKATVAGVEADAEAVARVVEEFCRLSAVAFVAEDVRDVLPDGQLPEALITIGLSGPGVISKSLVLGPEASPATLYAAIRGADIAFTIEKAVRDKLLQSLYKERASLEETPVAAPADQPEPEAP